MRHPPPMSRCTAITTMRAKIRSKCIAALATVCLPAKAALRVRVGARSLSPMLAHSNARDRVRPIFLRSSVPHQHHRPPINHQLHPPKNLHCRQIHPPLHQRIRLPLARLPVHQHLRLPLSRPRHPPQHQRCHHRPRRRLHLQKHPPMHPRLHLRKRPLILLPRHLRMHLRFHPPQLHRMRLPNLQHLLPRILRQRHPLMHRPPHHPLLRRIPLLLRQLTRLRNRQRQHQPMRHQQLQHTIRLSRR
mmetsp:Transcript_4003/g.6791  ORF Transcript_4003/g.6791 Transcript_4003/m.6791 type:complete len:246 (+) Transcript_4003:300-1037(+)